jgi:hypothetical protein
VSRGSDLGLIFVFLLPILPAESTGWCTTPGGSSKFFTCQSREENGAGWVARVASA